MTYVQRDGIRTTEPERIREKDRNRVKITLETAPEGNTERGREERGRQRKKSKKTLQRHTERNRFRKSQGGERQRHRPRNGA